MVPLIGGGGEVHAVIALQAHEAAAEPGGEHLGDLGLAGAGLALKKKRAAHRQRQVHGGGELAVGDIAVLGQQARAVGDGGRQLLHYSSGPTIRKKMQSQSAMPIQAASG